MEGDLAFATDTIRIGADVQQMIASGLIDPADAIAQFEAIESELYRFPAIDPDSFRRSVEELFR